MKFCAFANYVRSCTLADATVSIWKRLLRAISGPHGRIRRKTALGQKLTLPSVVRGGLSSRNS